jgi:hypothetical protein
MIALQILLGLLVLILVVPILLVFFEFIAVLFAIALWLGIAYIVGSCFI